MYDKPVLSLSQVRAALDAMLEEAPKQGPEPVAIAMVDDRGELLAYLKMDKCAAFPSRLALKKAYTCAMGRADGQEYVDRLKSQGRNVTDFGDPGLASVPGGVVIRRSSDGAILGGIGVSGLPSGAADEAISRKGLEALGV